MRFKIFAIVLCVLFLAAAAPAQSVRIVGKKTVYKRPKPIADFKKIFTVNYPKVSGVAPALARKIERAISYAEVANFNLRDEISEIQWLEDADFEVLHNANGVLTVYLSLSGVGAYPSVYGKHAVVDLKTGLRVGPKAVFVNEPGLAAMVKEIQAEEVKAAIAAIKADKEYGTDDPSTLFESTDFTPDNLDGFSVDSKGVTFYYDYGFPRVIKVFEPEGNYFVPWSKMKPFVRSGGLLARFVS